MARYSTALQDGSLARWRGIPAAVAGQVLLLYTSYIVSPPGLKNIDLRPMLQLIVNKCKMQVLLLSSLCLGLHWAKETQATGIFLTVSQPVIPILDGPA